jgi:hypothetical protein
MKPEPERPVQFKGLYSDHLFQPFHLSKLALGQFATCSPSHAIPRRSINDLTPSSFSAEFAEPGTPLILTDLVPTWLAYSKWTTERLRKEHGSTIMRAEAFDLPLATYLDYSSNLPPGTENPLYLFSSLFPNSLGKDFERPSVFGEDLLQLLPAHVRPTSTWLVLGPARSASTFHVDPNGTGAYNAVISGRKKWIFFPPTVSPPGVFKSPDGGEVTAPRTLLEWFLDFYAAAKEPGSGMLEAVCEAGECMFVPGGWWHAVLNLEDSVALTSNFCAEADVNGVLKFFRDKAGDISGVSGLDGEDAPVGNNLTGGNGPKGIDMFAEFSSVLQAQRPDMWTKWEEFEASRPEVVKGVKRKAAQGVWRGLVAKQVDEGVVDKKTASNGFSFGFKADEDDQENGIEED